VFAEHSRRDDSAARVGEVLLPTAVPDKHIRVPSNLVIDEEAVDTTIDDQVVWWTPATEAEMGEARGDSNNGKTSIRQDLRKMSWCS
jgi:hypothetical protein